MGYAPTIPVAISRIKGLLGSFPGRRFRRSPPRGNARWGCGFPSQAAGERNFARQRGGGSAHRLLATLWRVQPRTEACRSRLPAGLAGFLLLADRNRMRPPRVVTATGRPSPPPRARPVRLGRSRQMSTTSVFFAGARAGTIVAASGFSRHLQHAGAWTLPLLLPLMNRNGPLR